MSPAERKRHIDNLSFEVEFGICLNTGLPLKENAISARRRLVKTLRKER